MLLLRLGKSQGLRQPAKRRRCRLDAHKKTQPKLGSELAAHVSYLEGHFIPLVCNLSTEDATRSHPRNKPQLAARALHAGLAAHFRGWLNSNHGVHAAGCNVAEFLVFLEKVPELFPAFVIFCQSLPDATNDSEHLLPLGCHFVMKPALKMPLQMRASLTLMSPGNSNFLSDMMFP